MEYTLGNTFKLVKRNVSIVERTLGNTFDCLVDSPPSCERRSESRQWRIDQAMAGPSAVHSMAPDGHHDDARVRCDEMMRHIFGLEYATTQ